MGYDESELREVGQLCDSRGLERMGEQLLSQGDGHHPQLQLLLAVR